jgi:phage FluMu protein Com
MEGRQSMNEYTQLEFDEDHINDEELIARGLSFERGCEVTEVERANRVLVDPIYYEDMNPHLYNKCPKCGAIDDMGLLAEADSFTRRVRANNYDGFVFTVSMCADCWHKLCKEVTRLHYVQDAIDNIFSEFTRESGEGWRPFEQYYRGLITVEELHTRIHEMVDEAILFAIKGDDGVDLE